jgi:uncharacterized YccA/Bax inhibitor family protein
LKIDKSKREPVKQRAGFSNLPPGIPPYKRGNSAKIQQRKRGQNAGRILKIVTSATPSPPSAPTRMSGRATDVMTISGTVNKAALLLIILFATALFAWNQRPNAAQGSLGTKSVGTLCGEIRRYFIRLLSS